MLQFILRRLGLVIPTFIGITLLTFAFVHMIPGDPVMIMAGWDLPRASRAAAG